METCLADLYVVKRDGNRQRFDINKINRRINILIAENNYSPDHIKSSVIIDKLLISLHPGITTHQIDNELADTCESLSTTHPTYSNLAGNICVSRLHKETPGKFSQAMDQIGHISPEFNKWVQLNATELDMIPNYSLDYSYDYFGFKTLERAYLSKNTKDQIVERPQDMLLRTATLLQFGNIPMIKKTYEYMSKGYYTHASPTLFNSGTSHPQLSSCFLIYIKDDLDDIAKVWGSCAKISKWAGGIGIAVSGIRASGSRIKGTNGKTNGIVPFLRVYNEIARYANQGGKRPGSIAAYMEPHHPDIFEFLEMRNNFGSETERARDLFYALWVSDLFMKQVESDGDWYLLSADVCPDLQHLYGKEFEDRYWEYVNKKVYKKVVKARDLYMKIMEAQIETGMPYMAYKDSINNKSNQKNVGPIKSSNLCCEITEYTDENEYAVCNLASISLKSCVVPFDYSKCQGDWVIYTKPDCKYCSAAKNYLSSKSLAYKEIEFSSDTTSQLKTRFGVQKITFPQIFLNDKHIGGWSELYSFTAATYDFEKLYQIAYLATVNLNNVIDINYYPVPETKLSNSRHRPIGLGVQGLADALVMMRLGFDTKAAVEFNGKMMETIYLASMSASNDLSKGRTQDVQFLIKSVDKNHPYPVYYDKTWECSNKEVMDAYHRAKPYIKELDRKPDDTTAGAYSTFAGSPFSEGKFQFDLWKLPEEKLHYREQWAKLREQVVKYGTRNSLLTALMPTASTSQILGNNECFEFFTNNIYSRKTQAGSFILCNKYLVSDLLDIGLWNPELKNQIIGSNGSIQDISSIPTNIKSIYKTMWEIGQVWVVDGAVARGPFVDQTQSMNIFMSTPDFKRLSSCHMYGWKAGLKTGMYYLRTQPATNAIKFTIDPSTIKSSEKKKIEEITEGPSCESCSG